MKRKPIALVLAAGKGTRFKSNLIKILHPLLGKPMVSHVLEMLRSLGIEDILVVVGYQKERVIEALQEEGVQFVVQAEQLGTAHAVLAARDKLASFLDRDLLIINGDLPILRAESLQPLIETHFQAGNALTFVTAKMSNPYGFGRVVEVAPGKYKVIEEREASPEEKRIKLANVGIYLGRIRDLLEALPQVSNDNSKKEYYLTDLIEILSCQDKKVQPFILPESEEIVGVNDRFELAQAIRVLQRRRNREFCEKGVTLLDPDSIWIEMEVEIEPDTVIWPEVILAGRTRIGRECEIESFCLIRDSKLKNKVHVFPSSVIEGSCLDDETHVGPFTHLRPGTHLRRGSRVGNFVEMKKTDFGPGSKALHLSYLGDSKVGQRVNVGAGTITCNYDGLKKYETVIDDEVFVGSGTQLVAPVKVGRGAYIGAGSTITKNVSPEALAVARSRQIEKKGWARRKKRKKE